MQDQTADLKPFLSDLSNRFGRLEDQQGKMLAEVRSNHEALLRLEGTLQTRVAESRGKHDLNEQRDDSQDDQILVLHGRITNMKRGISSAIGMGLTALLAVAAMLTQWFSSR